MASSLKDKLADATNDEVEVDFSEAREGLGELEDLPKGTYNATVIECEPGESQSGNPKVAFKFEIAEDEKVDGCWPTVFRHAPTSGAGSGIFRDTVEALGFDIAALESGKTRFKCSEAIGIPCLLVIGARKGEPDRTEVKRVKTSTKKAAGATKTAAKRTGRKLG